MNSVRVTLTQVWEYKPNLDGDFYVQEGVKTVEEAMTLDQQEFLDGKVSLSELADQPTFSSSTWELFDDRT
jgi:hypothetical protein